MSVVLKTWSSDLDEDIMYSYQIVKVTNKDDEEEYVVYRDTGPLSFKVCGRYEYFKDAVKALHTHMENEF